MCSASIYDVFPTWYRFMLQIIRTIVSPTPACSMRSRFLSTRQGKNEFLDFVQYFRTLIAAMQNEPLIKLVHVLVVVEGLRAVPSRTEGFCVHLTTLERDVEIAYNAEYN